MISKPNNIKKRFDSENKYWKEIHSGKKDIVGLEVTKRKEFVKDFLLETYRGKKLNILEIGCGRGNNLEYVVSLDKNWKGFGVDISSEMIKGCKKDYKDNKDLDFQVLNIEEKNLDRKFNIIILLGVVGYFDSNKKSFDNIDKMLKKNGYLIFTYGNKYSIFRIVINFIIFFLRLPLIKDILNFILKKVTKRNEDFSKKSYLKSYSLNQIKSDINKNIKILNVRGIVFTVGLFGKFSYYSSLFLEKLFSKYDVFNLAYTKIVIWRKK